MDMASIDAMEPGERMQYLGNGIYSRVAYAAMDSNAAPSRRPVSKTVRSRRRTLVGEGLAGKITGMLLEMSTAELLGFMSDSETLRSAVSEAVAALPPDMLDFLGDAPPGHLELMPDSPVNPSPSSIMCGGAGVDESTWADCDDDEEALPPIQEMLASAERKRTSRASAGEDDMEMDMDDCFVCEWDAAQMAAQPAELLCSFIAERLAEPQVRRVRSTPRAVFARGGGTVVTPVWRRGMLQRSRTRGMGHVRQRVLCTRAAGAHHACGGRAARPGRGTRPAARHRYASSGHPPNASSGHPPSAASSGHPPHAHRSPQTPYEGCGGAALRRPCAAPGMRRAPPSSVAHESDAGGCSRRACTERCLHNGGMLVEETGKPRTAGGIYLKLLKDAAGLPVEAQLAALARIKKEGADAKKAQQRNLAAKRNAHGVKSGTVKKGEADGAASPEANARAKPSLADFMTAPQVGAA
jgi:hypothetical protein